MLFRSALSALLCTVASVAANELRGSDSDRELTSAKIGLASRTTTFASGLRAAGAKADLGRDLVGSCTGCWPGTSGSCKQANTVCHALPSSGSCYVGTTLCGGGGGGGGGGTTTDFCINSAAYGGQDQGCTNANEPVCVKNDNAYLPNSVGGDKCVKCINSYSIGQNDGGLVDFGCSAGSPRCLGPNGEADEVTIQHSGALCFAAPTEAPSTAPSGAPSTAPSGVPSTAPSEAPSAAPSEVPSAAPSEVPSAAPSGAPSAAPSGAPSTAPSGAPSAAPSGAPSTWTAFCINSDVYGGQDTGCSVSLPNCVKSDGLEPVFAAATGGTECATCVNAYTTAQNDGGLIDYGCSGSFKKCVDGAGNEVPLTKKGDQCV
jgi:hypothetical protein